MVGPLRPRDVALVAEGRPPWLPLLPSWCNGQHVSHTVHKLLPLQRKPAGVGEVCSQVAPQGQTPDHIKHNAKRCDEHLLPHCWQNPLEEDHIVSSTFKEEARQ